MNSSYRRLLSLLYIYVSIAAWGSLAEAGETLHQLPPMAQALQKALGRTAGGTTSQNQQAASRADLMLEVQRNYDLILARREQLEISREVQGHFEKAVKQAEKKLEKEDEEISPSAVTKLKLGLAGTLNDIAQFNSDIELAKLRLEQFLGIQWAPKVDISGPAFNPVDFPFHSVDQYRKAGSSASGSPAGKKVSALRLYPLKEAMIEVNKAREKFNLAVKNRKMTRALLVTEVANYDFGIGNEADLFEALIIYTRVLVGYYETVYDFNLSVYRFQKVDAEN